MSYGGDSTRRRILAATIELVDEVGIEGVRAIDVAARCDISTPLIYHYFANRSHLVGVAMAERYERSVVPGVEMFAQAMSSGTPEEALEAAAAFMSAVRSADRQRYRWQFLEAMTMAKHDPAVLVVVQQTVERFTSALERLVLAVKERGWLLEGAEPKAVTLLLLGLVFGLTLADMDEERRLSARAGNDLIAQTMALFLSINVPVAEALSSIELTDSSLIVTDDFVPPRGEDETRQRILEAAISELGERGSVGFRVKSVAKRAGVSVSLLYHYFGTRSGLLGSAAASAFRSSVEGGLDEIEKLSLGELSDAQLIAAATEISVRIFTPNYESERWKWLEVTAVGRTSAEVRAATLAEMDTLIEVLDRIGGNGKTRLLFDPRSFAALFEATVFAAIVSDFAPAMRPSADGWRAAFSGALRLTTSTSASGN